MVDGDQVKREGRGERVTLGGRRVARRMERKSRREQLGGGKMLSSGRVKER